MTGPLSLPVSFGEAADKISILEIKRERIRHPEKLENIERELALVWRLFFRRVERTPEFDDLFSRLAAINRRLWDIEEDLRACERRADFGSAFVRLARSVYAANDERARLKRRLDLLLESPIMEEKSYLAAER